MSLSTDPEAPPTPEIFLYQLLKTRANIIMKKNGGGGVPERLGISSILDKAKRKDIPMDRLEEEMYDIAGIRLICPVIPVSPRA